MPKWTPCPGFWRARSLSTPVAEVRVCPERRWRFDWAWIGKRVAVEVNGGIFARIRGRHSRGAGQLKDWEKLNHAQKLGWRVGAGGLLGNILCSTTPTLGLSVPS